MNKADHLDYLKELTKSYGKGNLVAPSAEGAFYFGHYLSHDEYVNKYREQCIKKGWLNANN